MVASILAELDEPRLTRSELEEQFLALCRDAGLPSPETGMHLVLGDGRAIEADFLFRRARLIVETDGRRFHATGWAFEDEGGEISC